MENLTRKQLLTLLHLRTSNLNEIRREYQEGDGDGKAARRMNQLAIEALCMGPSPATLCAMANEEAEQPSNNQDEHRA